MKIYLKVMLTAIFLISLMTITSCAHHKKCGSNSQCSTKEGKKDCANKEQCPMKSDSKSEVKEESSTAEKKN
jgi:hypothetical protein